MHVPVAAGTVRCLHGAAHCSPSSRHGYGQRAARWVSPRGSLGCHRSAAPECNCPGTIPGMRVPVVVSSVMAAAPRCLDVSRGWC